MISHENYIKRSDNWVVQSLSIIYNECPVSDDAPPLYIGNHKHMWEQLIDLFYLSDALTRGDFQIIFNDFAGICIHVRLKAQF